MKKIKLENKKVSVILSVYNDEKNIQNSVNSILNQSFSDFEFLIIDDCSTDNTLKILNKIDDPRVKIFKNEFNLGLTKSLNKLIKYAQYDFIARQDSDDISFPSRFEDQLSYINKVNIDGCTTLATVKGNIWKSPFLSRWLPLKFTIRYKNPFIHGSLMIKKSALINVGGYTEEFVYAQDYKLFLDLIMNGFNIKILKKNLYSLNMENNISSLKKQEQNKYFAKAKDIYF